jgi:hypothetical protein
VRPWVQNPVLSKKRKRNARSLTLPGGPSTTEDQSWLNIQRELPSHRLYIPSWERAGWGKDKVQSSWVKCKGMPKIQYPDIQCGIFLKKNNEL